MSSSSKTNDQAGFVNTSTTSLPLDKTTSNTSSLLNSSFHSETVVPTIRLQEVHINKDVHINSEGTYVNPAPRQSSDCELKSLYNRNVHNTNSLQHISLKSVSMKTNPQNLILKPPQQSPWSHEGNGGRCSSKKRDSTVRFATRTLSDRLASWTSNRWLLN